MLTVQVKIKIKLLYMPVTAINQLNKNKICLKIQTN